MTLRRCRISRGLRVPALWLALGLPVLAAAADAPPSHQQQTAGDVRISIRPRPPVQILAFYEARGFPAQARARIAAACLLTVTIRNDSEQVVWLEPARWTLETADGRPVRLLGPQWWAAQWDAVNLPPAQRATFGWTQLPAQRDLQPHEPVGGNLAIEPPAGAFRVLARFATGPRRQGEVLEMSFDGLVCPRDGAS